MEITLASPRTLTYIDSMNAKTFLKETIQKQTDFYDDKEVFIINATEIEGNNYLTADNIKELKEIEGDIKVVLFGYRYGKAERGFYDMKQYSKIIDFYRVTTFNDDNTIYLRHDGDIIASFIEDEILIVHYDIDQIPSPAVEIYKLLMLLKDTITLTPEEIKEKEEKIKREMLKKQLIERLKEREVRLIDELRHLKEDINSYTTRLINLGRKEVRLMDEIESIRKNELDEHAKEILSILDLPKIVDLEIGDSEIYVQTDLLYGRTKHDRIFKLAPYNITIADNGYISFECPKQYRRKSWWSEEDVHPHISLHGEACWGNMSSTIATLVSDREYKALVIMIINFLENINVDDVAGENCSNWDEVDEDGNVIVEGGTRAYRHMLECSCCGTVYDAGEIYICDECGINVCGNCITVLYDGTIICDDCGEVGYCEQCREYYHIEEINSCDNCGMSVCNNCEVLSHDKIFCSEECASEANDEESLGVCAICNERVSYDELYTCEECHEQICKECCTECEDGVVRCKECLEEVRADV